MSIWKDYYGKTKNNPPRKLLVKALEFVQEKDTAIDLGSGALNDARYLLEQGFNKVIAVDKEAVAEEVAVTFPQDRFSYEISALEEYRFPENVFDLVSAQSTLPFIKPAEFNRVFKSIVSSLKSGGVFTGQFFGDRDGWSTDAEKTFHTEAQAKELLRGMEVLEFSEEEKEGHSVVGSTKHWHFFHIIARKP